MTTLIRPWLTIFTISWFGLLAVPAYPCEMIESGTRAAVGADGSVLFLAPRPSDETPGGLRLLIFTATGTPLVDLLLDLDVVDAFYQPIGVDGQGDAWLRIGCGRGAAAGELCNRVVEISPAGDLRRHFPHPRGDAQLVLADDGILAGWVEEGELRLYPLGVPAEEAEPRRFALPAPVAGESFLPRVWTLGPGEEAAVLGRMTLGPHEWGDVALLRFGRDGTLESLATYPAAGAMTGPETPEGDRRLGPFAGPALGKDGALFALQYGYGADCSVYQPPSVAVFEPDATLRAVWDLPARAGALGVVGEELIVVGEWGRVWILGETGKEVASWNADLSEEVPTEAERNERRTMAAALVRGDTPESWVELYPWAEADKQQEIEGWLVEAGPEAVASWPDVQWRELGPALCAQHPRAATEALRRFDRSRGYNKVEWLSVLVQCFSVGPDSVSDYVEELGRSESYDERRAARLAFQAWGYPTAILDTLWSQAIYHPSSGEAEALLLAFEQTRERFDQALRHGDEKERTAVRKILLSTVTQVAHHDYLDAFEATVRAKARAALAEQGRLWAGESDPIVASTGRLILVGQRALGVAAAWPALRRDLAADPRLLAWTALALGQAISSPTALDALPASVRDEIFSLATSAATSDERGNPVRAFAWLHDLAPERSLPLLYRQSVVEGALAHQRQRLLELLSRKPWVLPPAQVQTLLQQPWLVQFREASLRLLVNCHHTLRGSGIALERQIESSFKRWLEANTDTPAIARVGGLDLSSLAAVLGMDEVRDLVRKSRRDPLDWLWLLRYTGAWPAIERDLEGRLAERYRSLPAAQALAPLGHRGAFEHLLDHGLRTWQSTGSLVHYGDEAQRRLLELVFDPNPPVRNAARMELAAFGPRAGKDPELSERLAAELRETFASGREPRQGTRQLLALLQPEFFFPAYLAALESQGGGEGIPWSLPFSAAILAWAVGDVERQALLAPSEGRLHPSRSRPARQWRVDAMALESAKAGGDSP